MEENRTIIYYEVFDNCTKCFEIVLFGFDDDLFMDAIFTIDYADGHGTEENFMIDIDELLEVYNMDKVESLFKYFEDKYKGNCLAWHFMIKELEEKGLEVDINASEYEDM